VFTAVVTNQGTKATPAGTILGVGIATAGSHSVTAWVDDVNAANAAPAAVYESCRWASSFSYTIPDLTPGGRYTVRLHFAELTWTAAGQRKFNVSINGTGVLSAFDIFAAAGARNKVVVEQFTAVANTAGQVVIAFTQAGAGNPEVNGIEILH
jgi:Malectin domain